MRKLVLILMLIPLIALASVSGLSDKVVAGPFTIGYTLDVPTKPTINVTGPVKQNGFDAYYLQLNESALMGRAINVTIDDYRNKTDVSESRLMNLITDMIKSQSYKINWNKIHIGNASCLIAQVRNSESLTSYSISAYSPDGNGETGNTIVLVRSSLPDQITTPFLQNLEVMRT
jgi:hypothetical protein